MTFLFPIIKIHGKCTIFTLHMINFYSPFSFIHLDRVIDDLNPGLTFTRREVESLLHFVDDEPDPLNSTNVMHPQKDMETVLRKTCIKYPHLITKVWLQPYRHFHLMGTYNKNLTCLLTYKFWNKTSQYVFFKLPWSENLWFNQPFRFGSPPFKSSLKWYHPIWVSPRESEDPLYPW